MTSKRDVRLRGAIERAADALLMFATTTVEEKRGRVALAAAHLLHDGDQFASGTASLALVTVLEAMSSHATETHLQHADGAPKLALGALSDGMRALEAVRELLAEVCR